jgi:hypothetical protein
MRKARVRVSRKTKRRIVLGMRVPGKENMQSLFMKLYEVRTDGAIAILYT